MSVTLDDLMHRLHHINDVITQYCAVSMPLFFLTSDRHFYLL